MSVKLGDDFPNYRLRTTFGNIQLYDWLGNKWGILFSYPADLTPVCTTELSRAAKLEPHFAMRNAKLIGLSCDSIEIHRGWIKDIQSYGSIELPSGEFPFPIIDDSDRKLTRELGMSDPAEFEKNGLPRTARAIKSRSLVDIEAMSVKLGDDFPNYRLRTTFGDIQLYDWLGNKWGILFSYPADFTPVCTTELSRAAKLEPHFALRNAKLIGLSCDSIESHRGWIKDIQSYGSIDLPSGEFPFPIIDDNDRKLTRELGISDPAEFEKNGLPRTARAVFFIGPDKKVKATLLYPAACGRNFDEILRLLDALLVVDHLHVATPVDWKVGDKVMVPPNVDDNEVEKYFPQGVAVKTDLPSGKGYIRTADV
ncbi:unnamed protein product [Rotaria sp. Silwood2]|nr:unnamed protein product [Rotaria sp. Silwood2]